MRQFDRRCRKQPIRQCRLCSQLWREQLGAHRESCRSPGPLAWSTHRRRVEEWRPECGVDEGGASRREVWTMRPPGWRSPEDGVWPSRRARARRPHDNRGDRFFVVVSQDRQPQSGCGAAGLFLHREERRLYRLLGKLDGGFGKVCTAPGAATHHHACVAVRMGIGGWVRRPRRCRRRCRDRAGRTTGWAGSRASAGCTSGLRSGAAERGLLALERRTLHGGCNEAGEAIAVEERVHRAAVVSGYNQGGGVPSSTFGAVQDEGDGPYTANTRR